MAQFSLDTARDAIYWIRQDGSIFYANEAAEKMTGYDRKTLTQMSLTQINCQYSAGDWTQLWLNIK